MEQANLKVGQRIRSLREQRRLSLRALARACGLSSNAISLIERGENSPTVSSLHSLAMALGVSITDFFENQGEQAIIFVRPETRRRSEGSGIILESLGSGLTQQHLEPFLLTIAPGAGNMDQPAHHMGQEFVYCLAGEIDYCIGEQKYRLKTGDSLLFDARLAHCFVNMGNASAQLMLIFYTDAGNSLARRLGTEATWRQSDAPDHPHIV